MTTIDISEDKLARESGLLKTLLKDRTTNQAIVWGTTSYAWLGKGFGSGDRIRTDKVTGRYARLIQPRSEKSKIERKDRTRVRAEVFTPTWLVEKQSGFAEKAFEDLELDAYIGLRWLEITCGEAPYMVSRYDTVTGYPIPLDKRVGFVDRKLQRLCREVDDEAVFFQYCQKAYQSSYGYEYQGDSLLLARENLLATFEEYYQSKFAKSPSLKQQETIAKIISYNVFQMDGLNHLTPYSGKQGACVQLDLFGDTSVDENPPQETLIKNWRDNQMIAFKHLSSEESNMKFDVVIGNPPYQEEIEGTSDKPIYNYFMDEAYKVGDKSVLITPARFLFNAGKTPKKWNQKMLTDEHLKVTFFKQDSSAVFSDTDIKGGVAITYRDNNEIFGPIGTFTAFEELNGILHKVIRHDSFENIIPIIYLQNRFNLEVMYSDFPEYRDIIGSGGKEKRLTTPIFAQLPLFSDQRMTEEDIKVLGLINNKRLYKYIHPKYIEEHDNLNYYKVILPKSNGSGAIGEVLSTPLVGAPLVGYTQSFISFGQFDEEMQAENCLKYIKSKFARVLLGTLKITQDNNRDTWKNVPLQDFTVNSDIDWSQSVVDIDRQLYLKYGLSAEEISFIETHVKEMD